MSIVIWLIWSAFAIAVLIISKEIIRTSISIYKIWKTSKDNSYIVVEQKKLTEVVSQFEIKVKV